MSNHNTKHQSIASIRDFNNEQTSRTTAFVSRKIALAAVALYNAGRSYSQIAKDLELSSAGAVSMLITRYGK